MSDRLLSGRYRFTKIEGEGGITRVHRAIDEITGETIAIKELISRELQAREAIYNEYRFASIYRHPSLVAPKSLIEENDTIYIVQPFIEGTDLGSWWDSLPSEKQGAGDIMASILECAAFIHFSGFSYNDYKPSNILVDREPDGRADSRPRPILIDYNLISELSATATKRGTIEYMAPEVLRGDPSGKHSDLYSIGAMFYELFAGEPPFVSENAETLIKLATGEGRIDFTRIPDSFQKGLSSMLSRDPGNRPANAREAAEILGVVKEFRHYYRERIDFYLTAGHPPFREELVEQVEKYLKGMSSKTLTIRCLNHNRMALNYLEAKYRTMGYSVWRMPTEYDQSSLKSLLGRFISDYKRNPDAKMIIFIDDLDRIGEDILQYINRHGGPKNGLPVIAGASRWTCQDLHVSVFDPLSNNTKKGATIESFKAYAKEDKINFDCEALCRATGGDPQLVYLELKYALSRGEPDLLAEKREYRLPMKGSSYRESDHIVSPILENLDRDQIRLLKKLSVWGDSIPMLVLGGLAAADQETIDGLLKSGRLIGDKGSVSFPSGVARDFIYYSLDEKTRSSLHRFWAETIESRMDNTEDYLELAAVHWGRSEDVGSGFRANLRATREFLKHGDLTRAKQFAEDLQRLAVDGGGSRTEAVSIYAAVLKEEGDYKGARRKYIELLKCLKNGNDKSLEARTYKELGDIYRSLKETKRAINYTRKALKLYRSFSDDQGIADCNNNIGLAYWVDEEYERAMSSFFEAFEANERLGNHRELAKIQSNIGIIKDIVGHTGEVADHFLQARSHATEAGDPRLEALISNNLGYFFIRQGDYTRATGYLQDALAISEKIGYMEGSINSLSNMGLSYLRSGDLFVAVDCAQKALEAAESYGSRLAAASAEVYLAEACILMGNYRLADKVLGSIEANKIYEEDKSLRPQIGLLRSRLKSALGVFDEAAELARTFGREADNVGDIRLGLEARVCLAEAIMNKNSKDALNILVEIAEKASSLGHRDIISSSAVILAELYLGTDDFFNAEGWINNVMTFPTLTKEVSIKARILSAELCVRRQQYDDALETLFEVESIASVSGFVPLALRAAIILGEVFALCAKRARANEAISRANSYWARLLAALPDDPSSSRIQETSYARRLERISVDMKKGEYFRV